MCLVRVCAHAFVCPCPMPPPYAPPQSLPPSVSLSLEAYRDIAPLLDMYAKRLVICVRVWVWA